MCRFKGRKQDDELGVNVTVTHSELIVTHELCMA